MVIINNDNGLITMYNMYISYLYVRIFFILYIIFYAREILSR